MTHLHFENEKIVKTNLELSLRNKRSIMTLLGGLIVFREKLSTTSPVIYDEKTRCLNGRIKRGEVKMLNCNLISLQNGANCFVALVSSFLPEAISLLGVHSS
ncbi:unnamed protein product, partial [Gulo gulo]